MSEIVIFAEGTDQRALLSKRLNSSQVQILESDQRSRYAFAQGGGFRPNLAYLRHPQNASLLIPLREYGDFILQEKFNEVLRVLTMLGASRVTCISTRTRGRRRGFQSKVSRFGARLGRGRTQASKFDYATEAAGGLPMDPRPLRWPNEPGIEAAIESVFRNRARTVNITVSRDQGVSLDGKLTGKFKGLGIELGFESTNSAVDTLTFTANFPDRDKHGRLTGRDAQSSK